jgi:hypothetical protein
VQKRRKFAGFREIAAVENPVEYLREGSGYHVEEPAEKPLLEEACWSM